jgi:hypothetical protein
MVSRRNDDFLLLALALLAASSFEEDPFLGEHAFESIRRRLRESEAWDPELDDLFHRFFRYGGPLARRRRIENAAREAAAALLEGFRLGFEPSITGKIHRTESLVEEIAQKQADLGGAIENQTEKILGLTDDLRSFVWLTSVGADISKIKMIRYIPVRVYLKDAIADAQIPERIVRFILSVTETIGLEKAEEFPEEGGSWWKRLILKTKEALTHKEVTDRLGKAERAAELAYLDKPQADANKSQAEAASSLITALKETNNACVQVGSLLIVKATSPDGNSCVMARTLTPHELKWLEENQTLLRDPQLILEHLQKMMKAPQLESGLDA